MSMPNIPNINPEINITLEQSIVLLIASIAMEELGQSHLINAEAEKIQYILGTLEGSTLPTPASLEEVLEINCSVKEMMNTVIKNQILLSSKLESALNIYKHLP